VILVAPRAPALPVRAAVSSKRAAAIMPSLPASPSTRTRTGALEERCLALGKLPCGSGYLFETRPSKRHVHDLTGERCVLMGANLRPVGCAHYEVAAGPGHSPLRSAIQQTVEERLQKPFPL